MINRVFIVILFVASFNHIFPLEKVNQLNKKKDLVLPVTKSLYHQALQKLTENDKKGAIKLLQQGINANDSNEYQKSLKLMLYLKACLGNKNLSWLSYQQELQPYLLRQIIRGYQAYLIGNHSKKNEYQVIILGLQNILLTKFQSDDIKLIVLLDAAELLLRKGMIEASLLQLSKYWKFIESQHPNLELSRFWYLMGKCFEKQGNYYDRNRAIISYKKSTKSPMLNNYSHAASLKLKLLSP